MTLLDLVYSPSIVVAVRYISHAFGAYLLLHLRGDWDITTVYNRSPAVERICVQWNVVATTKSNPP